LLGPQGSLCLVDFGDQARMPAWFRVMLFRWLAWFHVSPRVDIRPELEQLAVAANLRLRVRDLYRGYACLAKLERVS
jgi:S-adenosylmethionine-diacylgycerolhomoserine-N-methlytransferase